MQKKTFIAGHRGLVGSAVHQCLLNKGYTNLILRNSKELDLRDLHQTRLFFETEKPEIVILAAAKVGGIWANQTRPAEFLYDNLAIQSNVIHLAHETGVQKLLFLGSSCIYPRECPQPIKEEYLLTAPLEATNEAYAIAKIAGLKMCQAYNRQYGSQFFSIMPCNLYGPGDNFDLQGSHVLPALIHKFHLASKNNDPQVIVWGDGSPLREFLYSEDLAEAIEFLLHNYIENQPINVGSGIEISIRDLALKIASVTGFKGEIVFDTSKPNGTPRKVMDNSRIQALGWKPRISLDEGILKAYQWFLKQGGS